MKPFLERCFVRRLNMTYQDVQLQDEADCHFFLETGKEMHSRIGVIFSHFVEWQVTLPRDDINGRFFVDGNKHYTLETFTRSRLTVMEEMIGSTLFEFKKQVLERFLGKVDCTFILGDLIMLERANKFQTEPTEDANKSVQLQKEHRRAKWIKEFGRSQEMVWRQLDHLDAWIGCHSGKREIVSDNGGSAVFGIRHKYWHQLGKDLKHNVEWMVERFEKRMSRLEHVD